MISKYVVALSGLRIKSSLPIYIGIDGSFLPKTVSSFALVLLYCLCKSLQRSLFLIPSVFIGKAVAKVRSFSYILQIFAELFSKFFFETQLRGSLLKSGCKGKELFSNYQMFWEVFFRKFFRRPQREGALRLEPLSCERRESRLPLKDNFMQNHLQQHVKYHRFVSESGCKSTAYSDNCKLTNDFFSILSWTFFAICWFTSMFYSRIFKDEMYKVKWRHIIIFHAHERARYNYSYR